MQGNPEVHIRCRSFKMNNPPSSSDRIQDTQDKPARQKGTPKPPSPNSEKVHYLYDDLIDQLHESTIHIFLRCSQNHYMMEDFNGAVDWAIKAQKHAKDFYEPLSALCYFWAGKAHYRKQRYDTAGTYYQKASPAVGLYILSDDLNERSRIAAEAFKQSAEESAPNDNSVQSISHGRNMDNGLSIRRRPFVVPKNPYDF